MREGFVDNQYASLYYKEMGQGLPLVMLHGNGEDHGIFCRLARLLSRYYRIILMDSRGHGASRLKTEAARRELTTREMADDVVQVMEHLRIPQALILGFSDGANIALEAACHYPGRVLAVVAVSGNARPWGMLLAFYGEVRAKYRLYRLAEHLPMPRSWKEKAVRRRQLNGLMARWPRLTAKKLGQIKAPVLILTGRNDMIRPRHSMWMARQIPDAEIIFVKGADHFTLLNRERAYGAYIHSWLKKKLDL